MAYSPFLSDCINVAGESRDHIQQNHNSVSNEN